MYVLRSLKDGFLYYGYTTDLRKRVHDHNNGLNISTNRRKPLELLYYEAYLSEKDAKDRETFIKSGRGREVLHKQLRNTLDAEVAKVVKAPV